MRLRRLEIEGFGPFRAPQTIDFDAFAADGLFLIAGRTGAGKSSILDAVCFALYGSIPRYTGGEKRLRSDHSEPDEPSRVALEFEVGERRYRVERAPEYLRAKKSGTGLTKQAHEVTLLRWDGSAWEGLGARAKDVDGELLPEILQLTKDQFLQVILLAQNRFARFLLARNDERLALLRTLFGTRRFDDYVVELETRRKASANALAADTALLDQRLGDAEDLVTRAELGSSHAESTQVEDAEAMAVPVTPAARLEVLESALPRGRYRVEAAQAESTQAEDAHRAAGDELAAARERSAAQRRRDQARAELAALDLRAADVDADRAKLSAAEQAEVLRAWLEAATTATERVAEAAPRAATASAAWVKVRADEDPAAPTDDDADTPVSMLRGLVPDLAEQVGALDSAARLEQDVTGWVLDRDRAAERVAATETAVAEITARLARIPDALAALDEELARLAGPAAGVAERRAAVERAQATLVAARAAETARTASASAQVARAAASAALEAASRTVTELVIGRLDGFAGELAERLREGEPCTVCGSREHPHSARAAEHAVSAEDIESAERGKDAAIAADRAATATALEAQEALTVALAAANGLSVADAEESVAAARTAATAAESAAAAHESVIARRIDLLAAQARGDEERRAAESTTLAAREEAAALRERAEQAERTIATARGAWPTVAARRADANGRRAAAESVVLAWDELATRRRSSAEATEALAAQLVQARFPDATTARAALLPTAERARLSEAVAAFDQARHGLRARLLQYELDLLPEDPVDLVPLEEAVQAARVRWAAAQRAVAEAEQTATELERLVRSAATALSGIGDAAAEHAVLERLADTVSGREPNTMKMSLETFVLAAELEDIVAAANVRLQEMSERRYRLEHTDERAAHGAASGLGIDVFDAHTGRTRPASSLSGGETFLASLSLALGLAEVVTARAGGVQLDTLFIDEGFGTLDAQTLEIAMATLEQLRQGGRTIGVISHVAAMQERILSRLEVEVARDGSSVIAQRAGSPAL
ncbi:AAA family ATPase [Microbacterium gorillae]|uniref:AAA family ATPase n=1 Tax=Microbacterium gorillae TaxID=1231063 RepID=UPI00058D8BCA|nr:SMC family ATPase [Microbacterium gorillae]